MLTVVLVATLAAAALWRQWRGVEIEAAERSRVQASWILAGALDWSRLILAGDLRESGAVDHLGEPWAVPLAEARLSTFLAAGDAAAEADRDAFLSGEVTDLQSRLNLMNLTVGDAETRARALQRFQRLFEALQLSSGELTRLRDNLTRAQVAMLAPGSAAAAEAGDAPLLPRRFEQLAWLGVSAATLAALAPYATLLPNVNNAATPVNLNTASALVVFAAVPELDLAAARRLVSERERAYYKDAAQAVLSTGVASPDISWAAVRTSFFEVRARLRLDDVALEEVAVVQRQDNPRRAIVLWRARSAVNVPAPGAAR